jgi:hypothetical protein
VLDLHWYPEAQAGACVSPNGNDCSRGGCPQAGAAQPLGSDLYGDQLDHGLLLRRTHSSVATDQGQDRGLLPEHAPGNHGIQLWAGQHISGGIAQADVLGVFGREGLYAATHWRLSNDNDFIYGGFDAFRNYDGANGSFGDTSIRATNTDIVNASVYASVNAGNAARMVVVAINKSDAAQTAGIAVTHTTQFHTAQVYTLTSCELAAAAPGRHQYYVDECFQYTMPANSVTTLVLLP